MDTTGCLLAFHSPLINTEPSTPTLTGPTASPDFKKVRSYLRTIQHREALGAFIRAGWTPAELAELARRTYLAPSNIHPTSAAYRHAIENGADHPSAVETLASLLYAPRSTAPSAIL